MHDLKPELLINLPSSKNSITAVSTSESADHQTTDGKRTEPEDINFNPAATKSSVEALSELSSSAALSLPPENRKLRLAEQLKGEKNASIIEFILFK